MCSLALLVPLMGRLGLTYHENFNYLGKKLIVYLLLAYFMSSVSD